MKKREELEIIKNLSAINQDDDSDIAHRLSSGERIEGCDIRDPEVRDRIEKILERCRQTFKSPAKNRSKKA